MKINHKRHKRTRLEDVFMFIEDTYLILEFDDFDPDEIRDYCANMMDFLEYHGDIDCYQVEMTKVAPASYPLNVPTTVDDLYDLVFRFVRNGDRDYTVVKYTYSPSYSYMEVVHKSP